MEGKLTVLEVMLKWKKEYGINISVETTEFEEIMVRCWKDVLGNRYSYMYKDHICRLKHRGKNIEEAICIIIDKGATRVLNYKEK